MLLQLILREEPDLRKFAGWVPALEGTLMKPSMLISFHLRSKAYPGESAQELIALKNTIAINSLHYGLVIWMAD